MERRVYILKNIYEVHWLAVRIMDAEGEVLIKPFENFEKLDPVCCDPALRKALYECGERGERKFVLYEDEGYLYYVCRQEEKMIIWGPFVWEAHSEHENKVYLDHRGVKEKSLNIMQVDVEYIRQLISFLHGLLLKDYESTCIFMEEQIEKAEQEKRQAEFSRYIEKLSEEERTHFSFQREQEFWEVLLKGELDISEMFGKYVGDSTHDFRDMQVHEGILSESQMKHMEYSTVSFITILTRCVIMAGGSETAAYRLSDVSLQRLSKAKDIVSMGQIFGDTVNAFIQLLKESRPAVGHPHPYIEQSKEYIANNIFRKISLKDVAAAIGLNASYLSRIFSEHAGMSLSHYILEEKIKISCNLLKYSGKPVGAIAEYIGLTPQSYYTKVFKKIIGQTPAQYRKVHFDKKFIEK